ncbi:MAG: hypothetical protein AAFX40_10190 [Cyanobacteria bacterium J06639_1]
MLRRWAPTLVVTAATIAALVVYLQPSDSQARSQTVEAVEARRLTN